MLAALLTKDIIHVLEASVLEDDGGVRRSAAAAAIHGDDALFAAGEARRVFVGLQRLDEGSVGEVTGIPFVFPAYIE
jgi:hypothetical protein